MQNLLPVVLPRLETLRIEGLDAGPAAFYPAYQGYSLANLPSSVCHWLGAPALGSVPLGADILNFWGREFRQVILLVVDGLGLNLFEQFRQPGRRDQSYRVWQSLSEDALLAPLTSIVPSTTTAALTTLWTGVPTSQHGVAAYEVWLKEYGLIANMILHSPASYVGEIGSLRRAGFEPTTFLPVPTLGPHLLEHGSRAYAFQHHSIALSGLSQMLFPGVSIQSFRTVSDLWVSLGAVMEAHPRERSYLYIYWGDLDDLMHRYGPSDVRVALEWEAFSLQLARFLQECQARGQGDTLFILTADHGHNATPRDPHFEIRKHPGLSDYLVMSPNGEARLPFVYLRPGGEEGFRQYVEQTWPGQFQILSSKSAIQAGLFGETIYERFPDRVGDLILVPQEDSTYWWFPGRENHLLGRHGGMSRTEMLTPFFALAL